MKYFILAIVSIILFAILGPIGLIYSLLDGIIKPSKLDIKASKLFRGIAVSIDQLGNVVCANFFNDVLIDEFGHQFGDEDETISSCLGKNKELGRLTMGGHLLDDLLNKVDPGHSVKSIEKTD